MPENDFFREVDRSRYHANWSCLAFAFGIGLVLLAVGWWLARRYGVL